MSQKGLNLGYLRIEDDIYLQEHIAEYFAGAILMPKTLIEEFWKKEDGLESDNIRRLADMFDVSSSALEIRLQQISKLPTWYKLLDEEEIEGKILSRFQHPKVLQDSKIKPYTLIRPPKSKFDNRFIRFLSNASKNGEHLYFIMDFDNIQNLEH